MPDTSEEGQTGSHGNFRNASITPMRTVRARPELYGLRMRRTRQPTGSRSKAAAGRAVAWSKADTCRESWA